MSPNLKKIIARKRLAVFRPYVIKALMCSFVSVLVCLTSYISFVDAEIERETISHLSDETLFPFLGNNPFYFNGLYTAPAYGKDREVILSEIFSRHHDWTADDQELIRQRKIRIGMTPSLVLAALGIPKSKNITVTADGESEQWVYDKQYVYFKKSMVESFQIEK